MHYIVNKEKYRQIWTCLIRLFLLYLCVLTFAIKLGDVNYRSHWNILVLCDQLKMMSGLNMLHEKTFYCASYIFDKGHDVRFKYDLQKNVWFCFISNAWVHFSHKTKKLRFWKSLKYFNIFWEKQNDVRFEDVLSNSV